MGPGRVIDRGEVDDIAASYDAPADGLGLPDMSGWAEDWHNMDHPQRMVAIRLQRRREASLQRDEEPDLSSFDPELEALLAEEQAIADRNAKKHEYGPGHILSPTQCTDPDCIKAHDMRVDPVHQMATRR